MIGEGYLSKYNPNSKKEEEKFLKTKINNKELRKKGITTYKKALEYITKIGKSVKGGTVIDSAEKSTEIYEIIKKIFKNEYQLPLTEPGRISQIGGPISPSDYNLESPMPQELIEELEKEDIEKFIEDLSKNLKSKESKNIVENIAKQLRKELEEKLKEGVSNRVGPESSYVSKKEEEELEKLREKLRKLVSEEYAKGKSPEEIEKRIKKEFDQEVKKIFGKKYGGLSTKQKYNRGKKSDETYEDFSREKIETILTPLGEEISKIGEEKKEEIIDEVLEEVNKLKEIYQKGKLKPKNKRELKKLKNEAKRREQILKKLIDIAGKRIEVRRKGHTNIDSKRGVHFLGYNESTGKYTEDQTANIYSFSAENQQYWENIDNSVIAKVKNILKKLGAGKRKFEYGRKSGKLDVNELIRQQINISSGKIKPEEMEKVFKQMQKKERDYATGILLDVSGSTNNKINEDDITIDIEKRAAYVLGEATNVLKDKLAIYAFTSDNSRSSAKMYEVKKFEEAWGSHTKGKLGFLEPEGNTPLSIAIRALTKELHNRKEKNKIMYILTDGAPNNLSDTQKAMEEARNKKIYTVYINIDFGEGAKEYFSELAPYASYSTLVKNIEELPEKIFDIYLKRRKI
jgi:hypothetical protein